MAERCKDSCHCQELGLSSVELSSELLPPEVFSKYSHHKRPKLTSREKANDWFMKASRVVWLGVNLREEPLGIWSRYKDSMGNEVRSIYNDKYFEIWTFYT